MLVRYFPRLVKTTDIKGFLKIYIYGDLKGIVEYYLMIILHDMSQDI